MTSESGADLLVQLAWKTLLGAREACGEDAELTREVSTLRKVLLRLQQELSDSDSLLTNSDDGRRQELDDVGAGCEHILKVIDSIVSKYNALPEDTKKGKRLWQKVQFGNGEMQDLADITTKLSAHTAAIVISMNLCSLGCQGRAEKRLDNIGELEGIRGKIHWTAANMTSKSQKSIWEAYQDDDREVWREVRGELVKEGYEITILHKHRHLIQQYIEELGYRGVFDELDNIHDEPNQKNVTATEETAVGTVTNSDDSNADKGATEDELEFSSKHQSDDQSERSSILKRGTDPRAKPRSHKDKSMPHTPKSSLSTIDFEYIIPSRLTLHDNPSPSVFQYLDSPSPHSSQPLTPPDSPKTSKYLRFDKQIHVGSINPKKTKARSPEEQAAHDRRKERRRGRTVEQVRAHEVRKEGRKALAGKREVVVVEDGSEEMEGGGVEREETENTKEEFTGRVLSYEEAR